MTIIHLLSTNNFLRLIVNCVSRLLGYTTIVYTNNRNTGVWALRDCKMLNIIYYSARMETEKAKTSGVSFHGIKYNWYRHLGRYSGIFYCFPL